MKRKGLSGLAWLFGAFLAGGAMASASAGWTELTVHGKLKPHYTAARACVIPESGGYGPVWRVRLQVFRAPALKFPGQSIGTAVVRTAEGNKVIANPQVGQWLYDTVAGLDTHASRLAYLGDRVNFYARGADGINWTLGSSLYYSPANLATC